MPSRADEYRRHAKEMLDCAERAHSVDERLEYLKLAKAWIALAEGAEHGLDPDEVCDPPDAA